MFLSLSNLSSVGLLVCWLALSFSQNNAEEQRVLRSCRSDNLTCHANLMKSYMNAEVEPCDNFYEYACGNYGRVKPKLYSRTDYMADTAYALDDIAEELLGRMDVAETLNVSSELAIAQRFYNACLGAELHPFPASDPNYLGLIRSIGGFPAVDGAAWNASNFNWVNMSAHLSNYGARGLIREIQRLEYPIIVLRPEVLGFDSIVRLNHFRGNSSETFNLNKKRMRRYLGTFNLPENKIEDVIQGIFAFWQDALQSFQEESWLKEIDVTNYFKIAWQQNEKRKNRHYKLVGLEPVCARHPEAVANYLALQLLYKFDADLKDPTYQEDYCAATMRSSMWFLFKKLYAAEYFTEEMGLEMFEMVQELRISLRKLLKKVEWLSPYERQVILANASSNQTRIGSKETLADPLIQEILRLNVVDGSYAATNINLMRHKIATHRFSIRKSKLITSTDNAQEDVYFFRPSMDDKTRHVVEINPGVLQPPTYHHSWPHALKFGTLGFKIARELIRNSVWISFYVARTMYDHRDECIVDKYFEYLEPRDSRHYTLLLDQGGLKEAFEAYRSHRKKLMEDPTQSMANDGMPGLDLSPDQLFFLGFAQTMCYNYEDPKKTDINKNLLLSDLSTNEDFSQAFNCPVGSGMRPLATTCHLW
ncbi:neprilysin-4-like [Drosophila biarmipes]|uniref:neprilysin-4-like n=1 Tax=Drosophila biarmipes TaxID=125945 RepID=UPI0007E5DCB9|nr:neprilysin-4-like [Drosophila biarmipes]